MKNPSHDIIKKHLQTQLPVLKCKQNFRDSFVKYSRRRKYVNT